MRKAIIIAGIAAALVISGAAASRLMSGTAPAAEKTAGRLEVAPARVDLGDIDQNGGKVSARVTVMNAGRGPLAIKGLSTSCGCTTAKMDMTEMKPGESREMEIVFDPMAHPDQQGPIERVVYLQTSDPELPEAEIDVVGSVFRK